MKKTMMTCSAFLLSAVMLSGCSMWDGSDMNGTANATNETQPNTTTPSSTEDSMDNLMYYLNQQGITMENLEPINQMDFAAHEGKSFSYNGSTAYLYRLKSDDANMKALLDSAKKNGTVKVNVDGSEQMYNASVNGDYLFVYDPTSQMGEFIQALGKYVPGATTTTPNSGGTKTTPNTGDTVDKGTNPKDQGTTTTDDEKNADTSDKAVDPSNPETVPTQD